MAAAVTERELEVARILLQLPFLLHDVDLRALPARWGSKRRRSANVHQKTQRPFPPPPIEPLLPPVSVQAKKAGDVGATKEEETEATSSPVSPLPPFCFDQNGEDTDQKPMTTRAASPSSDTATRPLKKAKVPVQVQHKDWVREQNLHISRLQETNRNLEQQAAHYRMRHESLLAENSHLKELKSKCLRHQQLGVIPADPNEPPESSMNQEPAAHHSRRGIVSPQFLTLGGVYRCGGGEGQLPDLDALCHEDLTAPRPLPKKQRHHQFAAIVEQHRPYQRAPWEERFEKRIATAEARKRRIEIKRRKAAASAVSAAAATAV